MATTLNKSIVENIIVSQNPTIDVKDPIISDIAVNFGADLIEEVDRRVGALTSKFTSKYLSNLSSNELDVFALNVKGMSRKRGAFASGFVYFIYQTPTNISIPANTIVSTQDGLWEFYTTTNIFISINDVQPYLNPLNNEYEIKVPIQALNIGTDYNVAALRVNFIKSTISPAPSRIENREATLGGEGVESDQNFVSRIEAVSVGYNVNTKRGVLEALRSVSGVTDISIINRPEQNAFDVYFLGDSPVGDTIIKTATNSTDRTILFEESIAPVRYIDIVTVDGTVIDADQYSLSTDRSSLILASSVPIARGSSIVVSVQYNLIAQDVKSFINSNLDLIGTRWYVNEPRPFILRLNVILKPLSSTSSIAYYQQQVASIINNQISGFFLSSVRASELEKIVSASLSLASLRITINDTPSVTIPDGYYPFISPDLIAVTVL